MRLLAVLLTLASSIHAQVTYRVRLSANEANRVIELPAEQYVAGVLAGESSTFKNDEALKAMAVAARSYAARLRGRHSSEGFDFCATTHCQRVEMQNIPARFTRTAAETFGELLWSNGKPAFSVYTRDCGGTTEAVQAVWPTIEASYLVSHADPYCIRYGVLPWSWTVPVGRISQSLQSSGLQTPQALGSIVISRRTPSGRAKTLELEGGSNIPISAGAFRFAMGRELGWNTLRSDHYQVERHAGVVHFDGKGQGHGVGLCQVGADEMAGEGFTYHDILAFYYPGTSVSRLATGFHWFRQGGLGVSVFTTHPNPDSNLLVAAERARNYAQNRSEFNPPSDIIVRIYPDLDAFRNATGEPGWVAAHSHGSSIDLQPVAVLNEHGAFQSVLNHEMLLVAIETHAASDLPVWFREGLVEWLTAGNRIDASPAPVNLKRKLRQRQSQSSAQQAHAEAGARVGELVSRYGEKTVLGWVARGLPAEVRNSSDSNPITSKK